MTTPLFEMYRGDDYAFRVTITDVNEQPVDITGWEFKATMKLNFMDGDDKATVKVDVGPMGGTDAQVGICYLVLPHAQTENLLPAMYFFDLQRVHNGIVTTVIKGRVRVHADVTRRVD